MPGTLSESRSGYQPPLCPGLLLHRVSARMLPNTQRQQRQQERDEIKRNLFALFPDPQA
jgi:hypothetical protein